MSNSASTPIRGDPSQPPKDDDDTNESPHAIIPSPKAVPLQHRSSMLSATQDVKSFPAENTTNLVIAPGSDRVDQECQEATEKDAKGLAGRKETWKDFFLEFLIGLWNHCRPDFLLSHLDFNSFVLVSRSWLVVFVGILLCCITPVMNFLGPAGYLIIITPCIYATGGLSIAQSLYSAIADMILVTFSFAASVTAHAINWRIRNRPTVETVMLDLVKEGVCKLGDVKCLRHEMYAGRYLSTKTNVITIFTMLIALIILGFIQMQSLFFLLPWIMAAICLVITSVYLNFIPFFAPWSVGRTLIVPFGFSFALRVVFSMIYFPVTSNYKFFSVIVGSLKAVNNILDTTLTDLASTNPSDPKFNVSLEKLTTALPTTLSHFAFLELEGIMCRGEFAYSRLDPGDLGEFRALVRMVVNSFSGCRFYFDHISEKYSSINSLSDHNDEQKHSQEKVPLSSMNSTSEESNEKKPVTESHKSGSSAFFFGKSHRDKLFQLNTEEPSRPTGQFENLRSKHAQALAFDGMDANDVDLLHKLIMSHYADLTDAVNNVIRIMAKWAEEANKYRLWSLFIPTTRKKRRAGQQKYAELIKQALDNLKSQFDGEQKSNFKVWLKNSCETRTFKSRQHYLYFLGMDSFYGCSLERMAKAVQRAASYCLFLDGHQPEPRVIYPLMRTRFKAPRFEKEYQSRGVLGSDMDNTPTAFQPTSSNVRRNPDSSPPQNWLHVVGLQVQRTWAFLNDPQVVYITKRAIATVLSCFTYFARTTAFWSYNYRIAWVGIMVAVTVSAKAVDGVYGFIMKLTFTFTGSLAGLIIWYMGNGHGDGNPYGFCAAFSGFMAILMYYRHFHKLSVPMGPIVLCVTAVLVASTSWVDATTKPQDVHLGKGFRVAWIRLVSVSASLLIAFIATLLPQPVTAKKEIRVVLGKALETFGDCQASIANFAMKRQNDPSVHIVPRQDVIIQKLRTMKVANLTARTLTKQIRYEPPLGGVWPRHKFELLTKLIWDMGFLLEDVYFFLDDVKHHADMPSLLQLMGWTNIHLTSGLYSVLVLGSRALSTGNPLPSMTPGHLSDMYAQHTRDILLAAIEQTGWDMETLLEDKYLTHDGRLALAMIISSSAMFKRADGCLRLIKDLVGEIYGLDMSIYSYAESVPLMWSNGDSPGNDQETD